MTIRLTPPTPHGRDASRHACACRASLEAGFSLLELMIVLVIVGILAAVAYPSFQDSVRKGRRSDAFEAISRVQLAQERWRSNEVSYAASITNAPGDTPPGLGLSASSSDGHYTMALSSVGANGYTLTATAQGGQGQDASCKLLGVRVVNGNLEYGGGNTAVDWADPNRCWAR
jgi:type IV pilus assembly protein PilE